MKRKILTLSFVVVVALATTLNYVGVQSKTSSVNQGISLLKQAHATYVCSELYFGTLQCCKVCPGSCNAGGGPYWYGPIYF